MKHLVWTIVLLFSCLPYERALKKWCNEQTLWPFLLGFVVQILILVSWFVWLRKCGPRTMRSSSPQPCDMNQHLVFTNQMTKKGKWLFVLGGCWAFLCMLLFNYSSDSPHKHGILMLGIMAFVGALLFVLLMWFFCWRIYAKNTYTIEGNMLYIHEYEIHHTMDLQVPLADIDSLQFNGAIYAMGQIRAVINGNKIRLNPGFCAYDLYTALSQRI